MTDTKTRAELLRSGKTVDWIDALVQAAECLQPVALVASIDSALRLGQLAVHELVGLAAALPRRLRAVIEKIDALAESGLESIVRQLAVALGFRVESQVWFDGEIRADLVRRPHHDRGRESAPPDTQLR